MQASWHKRWMAYLGIALLIAMIAAACGPDRSATTHELILPTTTLAADSSAATGSDTLDRQMLGTRATEPAVVQEGVVTGPF